MEEIEKFLTECTSNKIIKPVDINIEAQKKIKDIDNQIDSLVKYKTQLNSLIRSFNLGKEKKRNKIVYSELTTKDKLDPIILDYAIRICEIIDNEENVTPRSIMSTLSVTSDKDKEVYMAIKWLGANGITKRDEENYLLPGLKWNERPITRDK